MSRVKAASRLLREAFDGWNRDNAPRLGAALSYYTLFSLAPLLVIAIAVAGLAFGREAAEGRIVGELSGLIGQQGAEALQEMVRNSRQVKTGLLAGGLALVTLVLGATGVFAELKSALNTVWNVKQPAGAGGVMGYLRERLVSLAMVLVVGFLLIVSLLASTAIAAAQSFLAGWFPEWQTVVAIANAITSFAVITLLFALIFKFLPDTPIAWRDVWIGAALTSLLFTIGKSLIGLYLGRSSIASVYGAAGSVVVVIVWVYYAAQIFFYGAELTQAFARRHGSRSTPQPQPAAPPAPQPAAGA